MFKVYSAQASQAFVWLLYVYLGNLGSYLTIALPRNVLKMIFGVHSIRVFSKFSLDPYC